MLALVVFHFLVKVTRHPRRRAAMPNLRVETNLTRAQISDLPACLAELSKALAATTGKPEQYMVVQVLPQLSRLQVSKKLVL